MGCLALWSQQLRNAELSQRWICRNQSDAALFEIEAVPPTVTACVRNSGDATSGHLDLAVRLRRAATVLDGLLLALADLYNASGLADPMAHATAMHELCTNPTFSIHSSQL